MGTLKVLGYSVFSLWFLSCSSETLKARASSLPTQKNGNAPPSLHFLAWVFLDALKGHIFDLRCYDKHQFPLKALSQNPGKTESWPSFLLPNLFPLFSFSFYFAFFLFVSMLDIIAQSYDFSPESTASKAFIGLAMADWF